MYEWGKEQFDIIAEHPLREQIEEICKKIPKEKLMPKELPNSLQEAIDLAEETQTEELP